MRGSHHESYVTIWSRDQRGVTWQFEKFVFPLSKVLWSLNLESDNFVEEIQQLNASQPAFTCPKLTIETLEQGMKYVQS